MSVEGKVVLITGAARGMGREHVRGFLKAGAKVVAADISWAPSGVSSDDYEFNEELAGNDDVLVVSMDVTLDSHVNAAYEAAILDGHRLGFEGALELMYDLLDDIEQQDPR